MSLRGFLMDKLSHVLLLMQLHSNPELTVCDETDENVLYLMFLQLI